MAMRGRVCEMCGREIVSVEGCRARGGERGGGEAEPARKGKMGVEGLCCSRKVVGHKVRVRGMGRYVGQEKVRWRKEGGVWR